MKPLLTGALFRPERYHFFPFLGSTNCCAKSLAKEGAPEGTVVVAEYQTQGRGRMGRDWFSPAGGNLHFSVVLHSTPRKAAHLTLLAGLALARTVADAGAGEVEIKWPNDILLDGRKLAGILTEMCTGAHGTSCVIVGMGVNVKTSIDLFPMALRDKVVTLAGFLRRDIQRPVFLANALAQLADGYACFQRQGFGALRQDWLSFSRICGKQVRVDLGRSPVEGGPEVFKGAFSRYFTGQVQGFDADGFLEVRRPEGGVVRVLAGDVTVLGET